MAAWDSRESALTFRPDMKSYNSVTSQRRSVVLAILAATALVTIFGMSISGAQDLEPEVIEVVEVVEAPPVVEEPAVVEAAAPPAPEVAELILQLEERDARIAVLHEQLIFLQQAALSSELQADAERDTFLEEQQDLRVTEQFQEQAMAEWRMGYSLAGGKNLRSFETIILPCESGGEADPDAAVGPTDDWGRAQINRPTWSVRFTELTGASFEENIGTPILNGYMAAHVESEQGLSAWTCWRKR